jgi:trimethylamine--corrinoid protein Co-methyltransferase
MAIAVQGSQEEFQKRPLVSFIAATTSPLKLSREPAQQLIECARMKVPVMLDSSPMCGATGPASLTGALVLQNAEDLAMNTLIQLTSPNSPVTYGPRCAPLDMRTGMPSWGSVEMALLSASGVQIAHHYGIPADTHGPTTNSKLLDEQTGFEKAICGILPALAGSEILSGAGALESLSTLSIEQLVIDDEFYSMVLRLVKGLEVNDDTLAVDLIRKVGHEGVYLKEEHTRRYYKQEHRLSMLFDAQFRNAWQSAGAKDTVQRAREKMRKILTEHKPSSLGTPLEDQLDTLLEDAKHNLMKA